MIQKIVEAIKAYFTAFGLISKLKLWKYFTIPILISIVTAVSIIALSLSYADNIGHYVANFWKWEFGKSTFEIVSTFLSGLLILTIGLILYKHIVMALSAPFMSPVSEKIEDYYRGENHKHRETSFHEQLIRGIRINVRNLSRELMLTVPILLLGLFPIIGIVAPIILFLMQAYYAGFGNMDYTLERHFKYRESINFVKTNKGVAIGNGIVFMLLLLIPIVGIILVFPLSVTAATTETIKIIQSKELPE
ncbi:EI24 domain-containing protein [Tenacibaculum sp. 190524A02b]|uniref:EI24 domain-containing protein n=1 Tax=Tenacibaculum vairaonense TaxID=3137860 RepID=UPI0031FA7042